MGWFGMFREINADDLAHHGRVCKNTVPQHCGVPMDYVDNGIYECRKCENYIMTEPTD